MKRKSILCKIGIHSADKNFCYIRTHYRNNTITSRSAFCKRCGKRLYLVDKYGKRRSKK